MPRCGITVIGAGPAGSAAAIASTLEGAEVEIREKSRLPRHKVCGEFLSPEILPLLEQLGAAKRFFEAKPATMTRMILSFGPREKTAPLPERGYGLSRYTFDHLLFESVHPAGIESGATIVASGRSMAAPRGNRLFGFKAHYRGPVNDAIELHFFDAGYVGVSAVENELTNICGLATERALADVGFDYDELVSRVPSLAARTRPLAREMKWLSTGPLVFANRFEGAPSESYYAGDALSFVDPFTGSGMYCAVLTGMLAGRCAARGVAPAEHLRLCRNALGRPFAFSSLVRNAVTAGWAERVAPFVPARLLYRLTRPATTRATK
jgi:2-polyprenyl-6-methoxyphenol hydroxylase-like FAD-dependent oxidoreductase